MDNILKKREIVSFDGAMTWVICEKVETSNWLNQSINSITYILYFNINIYTNLNIFIFFYINFLY